MTNFFKKTLKWKKYLHFVVILLATQLFFSTLTFAQTQIVRGTVTDLQTGEPLPGVNVVEKGTTNGIVTNADGIYSINVPANAVLNISFIGYETQEIPVDGRSIVDVVMNVAFTEIDEVVAIGYGVQKKSDVTGAMVSVNSEELTSRPVNNAVEAMQGKAAGVDITSNERPGTIGNITIRGVRSLTASNSPLYVVDGIPLVTGEIETAVTTSNTVTLGGIDNLNPNDIESIDILKDASATAIYGSRGANGVVIITTKKGKAGRFNLNFDSSVTIEKIHEYSPLFDAAGYIEYRRWAKYNNGESDVRGDQPTEANDAGIFTGDPTAWANIEKGWAGGSWDGSKLTTTDWTDFVTRTGITTQNTISASGGTDKMTAYGSFGYTDNKGVVKGQSFNRYSANVSVDIKPVDWFSFGAKLNSSYSTQEYGQSTAGNVSVSARSGLYESAYGIFVYALPYDADGNKVGEPGGDSAVKTIIDEDKYSQDQRVTLRAFGSFYGQLDIGALIPALEGLRYRANFGPDIETWRDGIFLDGQSVIRGGSAYAALEKRQRLSYTLDNLVYYDRTFGKHNFGLTLLQSQTQFETESSFMEADNIPFPSQKWNALDAVGSLSGWDSGITEQSLLSYMARLNYSFDDKYLLTVSGRYDGASQLSEGNKWSFFPSAALGWRLDREAFMADVNWVTQLKLRFGVGVTGNAAIDPYETKGKLAGLFYPFGNTSTAGQENDETLANPDLGWEQTTQYNIGLDFSVLNSRIYGNLDIYFSNTTDLLLQKSIPTVTGFENTFANIGETKSKGFDLTVNSVNIRTHDFEWSTTLNFSYQDNEIVSLANGKEDDLVNEWFIGESQDIIYDYAAAGIWQESDAAEMAKFNANGHTFTAGNVRPVDQNGDYVIDANNDRVVIGSEIPKYILGITNTFDYKGFELSVFLYGRMGYKYDAGGEGLVGRYQQRKVDYWTDTDTKSDYQKPIYSAGYGDQYYGSLGFKNGSFLKIRNITLGYNLPGKIAGKIGASKLRVYVQALNPGFVFNNVSWVDLDVRYHASNRGFVTGINLQF
ncbi:SusC/RagA family TonB-linked outer membrane protein [Maribellus maritimus]|uniref:SusC/RagA family TonB-linked outer membrane protein n=1 Tax=Maribellus maritimus TaxID=2870838 RepID=UPI001EEC8086|nr:TonB-dependent receptor [Maribellus maritimus]MCG6191033.1 TonB-dependent receptor [Maribellus maritimus]